MTGKTIIDKVQNNQLLNIVNKGMSTDPKERYKNIDELFSDCKKIK